MENRIVGDENVKQKLLPKKRPAETAPRLRPEGRTVRDCLLLCAGGFVLAGAQLHGQALPLAAVLAGGLTPGMRPVAAAIGALAGYALRWDAVGAAEQIALTALVLAALVVFQGTTLAGRRWFLPVLSACVCAILGSVSLLGGGEKSVPVWVSQWALAGAGCFLFRCAVRGSRPAQTAMAALLCAGASFGACNPGLLAAAALVTATAELFPAAAAGLSLALLGEAPYAAAVLLLPALAGRLFPMRGTRSLLTCLFGMNAGLFLCGAWSAGGCLAVSAGVALGALLRRFLPPRIAFEPQEAAKLRLERAAEVLELLRSQLPAQTAPPSVSEAEGVYDGAAERVCRCCERFHHCWRARAAETYAALSSAARGIIERGVATVEDFPEEFRAHCCHMEGFVTAVNHELEGMLYRRRYRMELQESRQVLAEEFSCLADFLRASAEPETPLSAAGAAYVPEVGVCSIGRNGARVNGDRGVRFAGVRGDYYILLCDGMGTGTEASRLCAETVRLIERLLKSGLAPDAALRLLNGAELLRGAERYTTIDLLHLDLHTGKTELYKWGAAPSYFRDGSGVKKIGTAAPPPGVGVGGENTPERYRLSLNRGEMLVLVSDGAGGEETEAAVAAYSGESARELAALLVAGLPAEDDMTAVVVSLRLCSS